MEDFQKILDVLGEEAGHALAVLTTQQESSQQFGRASFEKRVREEFHARKRVDQACFVYARTLRWPEMSKDDALFAHDRVMEGLHFGRWLVDAAPPIKKRSAELWLVFLLVSYWEFAGASVWRGRIHDMSPKDDE